MKLYVVYLFVIVGAVKVCNCRQLNIQIRHELNLLQKWHNALAYQQKKHSKFAELAQLLVEMAEYYITNVTWELKDHWTWNDVIST